MFGIGGWEMLLIGVVALLVFGPKRLPELARSLGRGLAEFRRASSDLRRSFDLDLDPARTPAPPPETRPPAQAGDPAGELAGGAEPTDPSQAPPGIQSEARSEGPRSARSEAEALTARDTGEADATEGDATRGPRTRGD